LRPSSSVAAYALLLVPAHSSCAAAVCVRVHSAWLATRQPAGWSAGIHMYHLPLVCAECQLHSRHPGFVFCSVLFGAQKYPKRDCTVVSIERGREEVSSGGGPRPSYAAAMWLYGRSRCAGMGCAGLQVCLSRACQSACLIWGDWGGMLGVLHSVWETVRCGAVSESMCEQSKTVGRMVGWLERRAASPLGSVQLVFALRPCTAADTRSLQVRVPHAVLVCVLCPVAVAVCLRASGRVSHRWLFFPVFWSVLLLSIITPHGSSPATCNASCGSRLHVPCALLPSLSWLRHCGRHVCPAHTPPTGCSTLTHNCRELLGRGAVRC
jgi:hypothetical protein